MNLQQLYYFHKIAELKNYTKASQELAISQSNLSHSMANLEEELGVPLFMKRGRNIDVTPYGKRFDIHVSAILKELELAQNEIKDSLDPSCGQVRIAVAHTLSHNFVPNMIRYYKQIPGNQNVDFCFMDMEATANGIDQMDKEEVDLCFGARIDKPGYSYFEVMHEELVAVVPENHPMAKRDNVTLEEVCREPFVTYNYKCGTRHELEKIFRKYDVWPRQISDAKNEKIITSMVASGMGVSIMPRIAEINIYPVVPIPLENHQLRRSLYMFWKDDQFRPPVVEQFRKFIIDTLKIEKL